MTTPAQALKARITETVKGIRDFYNAPDLPIEICTHPALLETVSKIVTELGIDGLTTTGDDMIFVRHEGDVKKSVIEFCIPEKVTEGRA